MKTLAGMVSVPGTLVIHGCQVGRHPIDEHTQHNPATLAVGPS